ncbi:cofactor-independent phosphoglycerate mutase [Lyngbya sp. PCC 8106]|nr:cofactor-independent phosphoglycerate mutase [Lyngbya sp. PCC 8106]
MGSPGGGRSRDEPKTTQLTEEQVANITQDKEVKAALGRPIKRIIRDKQDKIILNVGDLITHKAVLRAREIGVLDVLLNSVYRRPSQPSIES